MRPIKERDEFITVKYHTATGKEIIFEDYMVNKKGDIYRVNHNRMQADECAWQALLSSEEVQEIRAYQRYLIAKYGEEGYMKPIEAQKNTNGSLRALYRNKWVDHISQSAFNRYVADKKYGLCNGRTKLSRELVLELHQDIKNVKEKGLLPIESMRSYWKQHYSHIPYSTLIDACNRSYIYTEHLRKPRPDRIDQNRSNILRGHMRPEGRPVQQVIDHDGYGDPYRYQIGLRTPDGKTKVYPVSRLVYSSFIGIPEHKRNGSWQVTHVDHNGFNHHLDNLSLMHQSDKQKMVRLLKKDKFVSYSNRSE